MRCSLTLLPMSSVRTYVSRGRVYERTSPTRNMYDAHYVVWNTPTMLILSLWAWLRDGIQVMDKRKSNMGQL
jgi:hypothetical protein